MSIMIRVECGREKKNRDRGGGQGRHVGTGEAGKSPSVKRDDEAADEAKSSIKKSSMARQ